MTDIAGGCYKISYSTSTAARIAAEAMRRRKGDGPIRIYLCELGDHFHTTSMQRGEKRHARH